MIVFQRLLKKNWTNVVRNIHFVPKSAQPGLQKRAYSSSVQLPNTAFKTMDKDRNGFFVDPRGSGQRELVNPDFRVKDKSLRVEIADSEDIPLVSQYLTEQFVGYLSMARCINATFDEVLPLMTGLVTDSLPHGISPIMFHDDKLINVYAVDYFDEKTLPVAFPFDPAIRQSGTAPIKLKLKEDYEEEIAAAPFPSVNANKQFVFLTEFSRSSGNKLPMDCQKLAFGEAIAVHPDYKGLNLMFETVELIEKTAVRKYNCDYFGAIAVATASNIVAKRLGRYPIAVIDYKDFKASGEPVFQNLYDDCEAAVLSIVKIKKESV